MNLNCTIKAVNGYLRRKSVPALLFRSRLIKLSREVDSEELSSEHSARARGDVEVREDGMVPKRPLPLLATLS